MAEAIFKGFKQVSLAYFNEVPEADKKGYIWFVRNKESESYEGDIYLGNRPYGHIGNEVEEAVELVTEVLKEAGIIDESGRTIDIISLIEESKLNEGKAISISGNSISVITAEETINKVDDVATNKNFLKVNDDNELEVKGVDADATVTVEDITIAGGPLAEFAKRVYSDGKIPSGTSLQEFLKVMLCTEIWGNPSISYTFTASAANPSATLNQSGSKPVGTEVKASATRGVSSASQRASVSGFGESGYFIGDTVYMADTYNQNKTPNAEGDYILNASFTGFKEKDGDNVINATDNDGSEKTVYVSNGTNKYTVNETGLTYTPAEFETVVLNDRSNLGGKSATGITISESGFESSSAYAASKATNSSKSVSITGYYPIYYGTIDTVNATDGDFTESVLTGFGNGNSSIQSSVTTPTGTGAFAIAIPEGNAKYNSSELVLKDSKDMDFGKSHNFLTTISMLNNIENKNYKVFYITNANPTTGSASWTLSFKN